MQALDRQLPASTTSTAQWLFRWFAWPLGMATAAAAAWLLVHHPALAVPLQMATMVVAISLVVTAERIVPFRRQWQVGRRADKRTDVTSKAVLIAIADLAVKKGLLPLIAAATIPLVGQDGTHNWFPGDWPFLAQLALAAVIAEFGQYWVHRASHTVRWMWGAHGFHHNPTRLYWLNGFRVNPFNMVWYQLAGLGVLVAIGTPVIVIQVLIVLSTVVTVFQHANADLEFAGWNLFFGTADLHRWHHATGSQVAQANFGTVLMLWDQLFGTYKRGRTAPGAVGVDAGPPRAAGYFSGMAEAMRNALRGSEA